VVVAVTGADAEALEAVRRVRDAEERELAEAAPPRPRRWWATTLGARCRKCGAEWRDVFGVYDERRCPKCGFAGEEIGR
jgi:predicted Zn-ribbon and HTH transcriptional regulator